MDKKVSIISACFNGESHIIPHFEGILSQNYKGRIEYIFVNDGSTDSTEQIALSYKEKFLQKNIDFKYFKKENGGQASAINLALREVQGEYLAQIDSDDIILENYVSKLSNFLNENPDCAFCFPTIEFVYEKNIKKRKKKQQRKRAGANAVDLLFFDLISGNKNIPHCSFAMYRTKELLNSLLDGQISQKYQSQIPGLVYPMAFQFKAGYLDETLAYYVFRQNSHGHTTKNLEQKINDWEGCALEAVLRLKTNDCEKAWAYNIIKNKYIKYRKKIFKLK